VARREQDVVLENSQSRWSRRMRPAALVGALGVLAVTLSGCSQTYDWKYFVGFGWPKGITPEAHANYKFWLGMVIASVAVGMMVWGMIFWTTIFHRKKSTDTELPRQFGYNMPLEMVLTALPFLAIAVIFFFTVEVQQTMVGKDADPEVVVDVTGFQWNWKFGYQKVDYRDGTFKYDGVDHARQDAMRSKPEGVDKHGEELVGPLHGKNLTDRSYLNFDKVETLGTTDEIPVLVVPAGKRIEFVLNSADVVHAFWVPEFLFKRDVMPEPAANNQKNTFQVREIELPEGQKSAAFVGRCAELCGTYHAMMNFELRVVSPNNFKAYLQQRQDGKSNSEALAAIDSELGGFAVTTRPFDTRRGVHAPSVSSK
jgi:cytochrome c oxidase subunit 2